MKKSHQHEIDIYVCFIQFVDNISYTIQCSDSVHKYNLHMIDTFYDFEDKIC